VITATWPDRKGSPALRNRTAFALKPTNRTASEPLERSGSLANRSSEETDRLPSAAECGPGKERAPCHREHGHYQRRVG
jgi:hypothetical protein